MWLIVPMWWMWLLGWTSLTNESFPFLFLTTSNFLTLHVLTKTFDLNGGKGCFADTSC